MTSKFNGQYYLQIKGTAMGKRFAPAYANIYMAEWEKTTFEKCRKLPKELVTAAKSGKTPL